MNIPSDSDYMDRDEGNTIEEENEDSHDDE
jgi:hypothetical protein